MVGSIFAFSLFVSTHLRLLLASGSFPANLFEDQKFQITADASKITPIKVGGDAVDLELPSTVSTASRMVVERPHRKSIATLSSGIGIIDTVAGGGGSATLGDGVKAISATLNTPMGLAVDALENIYIAEYLGNRIRLVTKSTGIISTVAGNGKSDHSGDGGQATVASLNFPSDVAVDTSGNIYIAESASNCIRMVTKSTGIITTVAGMYSIFSPLGYYSGDGGQATSAALNIPGGVAVDASGNIYIADTSNYRIRLVTKSTGIITTVAGSSGFGFNGDGGQATSATLNLPGGVAVDASGNIYIADTSNYRIRLVTKSTGIISTVAGTATSTGGQVGDGGLATSAALNLPAGIVVDASGNVYIADTYGYRIRLVTKSTGILSTVAGTGSSGGNYDTYGGDGGKATLARLSSPSKLALDASGNIYVSDSVDRRIRMFKLLTETNVASTSSSPSPSPTTSSSTVAPSSSSPSPSATTSSSTAAPSSSSPSLSPTTSSSTAAPSSSSPSLSPTTSSSTVAPSSLSPSRSPTTSSSTAAPSSVFLNPSPTTSSSTVAPSSSSPSPSATTSSSTAAPSSVFLNPSPTTSSSTVAPSSSSPSPSATTSSSTAPSSPSVPTAPSSPVIPGASSKTSASQGNVICPSAIAIFLSCAAAVYLTL